MRKLESTQKTYISEIRKAIKDFANAKDLDDFQAITVFNYLNALKNCVDCQGLNTCAQANVGFKPVLNEETFELLKKPCKYEVIRQELKKSEELQQSYFFPKALSQAKINEYRLDSVKRKNIHHKACAFLNEMMNGREVKGMYIYGSFGVGKTYLCACLSNELAKAGIASILVYFPDFIRNLKSSFENNSVEEKINHFKTVPVLFIDDLGSENITPWVRDEILGPILQYRYLNGSPTFITSNLTMQQLLEHLADAGKTSDNYKAGRIISRIKELTIQVEL
ncbi:MAG: primosomal protein DnaI [Erysipelotrichales bacterium]|nr:primosomal protein DnaI [Erysipelotrichales bacterium]